MPRFNVSITLWARKGFETFAKPHLQRNQEDASCAGSAIEPEKLLVKEKITASLKKNVSQALYQMLPTTKMNFEKLLHSVRLTRFQNPQ